MILNVESGNMPVATEQGAGHRAGDAIKVVVTTREAEAEAEAVRNAAAE
jgi:hypothetical protein